MPRGGRPGQHLRGGRPGIDSNPSTPDVHYFRHAGVPGEATGFEQETAYSWGRHTWETLNASNYVFSDVDNLICLPQVFPRACTIAKLLFKCLSGVGTGLRFGIYANRADGLVYPGRRLWKSADYNPNALQAIVATPALPVDEPALLWLVMQADPGSSAVETIGQFSNECLALGGLSLDAWSTNNSWASAGVRPFVGWLIPAPYADGLPLEAPTDVGETTILSHSAGGGGYQLPQLGFTLSGMG